MRLRFLLAGVVVAALPGSAWPQSTLRAGGEFRVSEYATGDQRLPSAVAGPDGTYFIVWESQFQDGDSFGIFGRFVSPAGVPLGPEFQINQATGSDQKQPSVTVDASGRYTVAWTGQDVSGGGVFARQYTSAGPLGPEFQVNAYTTGDQFLPKVSAGPGGIGVVWQSDGQDGSGMGVYGRLYSASGAPATNEFRLSSATASHQLAPVVAALDSGRYAVAWGQSTSPNPFTYTTMFSRLFDTAGAPVAADAPIPFLPFPGPGPVFPGHLTIGAVPGGQFATAWWSFHFFGGKDIAMSTDFGVNVSYHDVNGNSTRVTGAGGNGVGTIAHWQGALGGNFRGLFLVAYTSTPGALTCINFPPFPNNCPPTVPEDGSGSAVFARPVGAPGLAPRVLVNTTTTGDQLRPTVGSDVFGNALIAWQSADSSGFGVYAQRFGGFLPVSVAVDPTGNGVIDPGVDEEVRPSWRSFNGAAQTLGGTIFDFAGPAGLTYDVVDGAASYGTVPDGATQACTDCYSVRVSLPGPRPATHVDSYLGDTLTPVQVGVSMPWTLHVGGSFADVSTASPFYRHIETLLHNGITSGCGGGSYCAASSTSRDQMSVFVLLAKQGAAYLPPACTTPMFADVPAASPFCRWIEELARRGVVAGCGGGNFCPGAPVTREQMAVFVLRTLDPALDPPACTTPVFGDVPASSPFCRWIEELVRRGVVSGCGGGNYCPAAPVTREQMAVFLSATFGLRLY
jgi:hypothetical protein